MMIPSSTEGPRSWRTPHRILVVIPHYCGPSVRRGDTFYGSGGPMLPRLLALQEAILTLHRNFGPDRVPIRQSGSTAPAAMPRLDIVIVTVAEHNILDQLQLAPGTYDVDYFTGDPMQLIFEAQRILRERMGEYDFYGMIEDDIAIHDPLYFDKLDWFIRQFGDRNILNPHRFEISKTGRIAKFLVDPILPRNDFWIRPNQIERIEGSWHGSPIEFELVGNPHSAGYFVSDSQLRHWVRQPSFYDRDASWVGPLESAGSLSLGRTFDIYKPIEPHADFLEVEHYGIRFASLLAPEGTIYGEALALRLVEAATDPTNVDGRLDAAKFLRGNIEIEIEFDRMRRENADLQSRLGLVEAAVGSGRAGGGQAAADHQGDAETALSRIERENADLRRILQSKSALWQQWWRLAAFKLRRRFYERPSR